MDAKKMLIINGFISEIPDDFEGSIGDLLIYLGNKMNDDVEFVNSDKTEESIASHDENIRIYENAIGYAPKDIDNATTFQQCATEIVENDRISSIGAFLIANFDGVDFYDEPSDPCSDNKCCNDCDCDCICEGSAE